MPTTQHWPHGAGHACFPKETRAWQRSHPQHNVDNPIDCSTPQVAAHCAARHCTRFGVGQAAYRLHRGWYQCTLEQALHLPRVVPSLFHMYVQEKMRLHIHNNVYLRAISSNISDLGRIAGCGRVISHVLRWRCLCHWRHRTLLGVSALWVWWHALWICTRRVGHAAVVWIGALGNLARIAIHRHKVIVVH